MSRFDPWKDPVGVIEAFRIVREEFPDAQLVLAGSMATDDPEGFHFWELADEARAGDPDIHLLSNIQQVGAVQINAFQRAADVVMQKSLREGFGLTVSEALWKGRPVVGGRCGGITMQIQDGENGYLVDSVEDAAARTIDLLAQPDPGRRDGRDRPRPRAQATSCRRASSKTGCACSETSGSARMIVVSHRGPYRFEANGDGSFTRRAGRRRCRQRARRRARARATADATWIAAAHLRRRPRGRRSRACSTTSTSTCGSSRSTPTLHTLHYDVVSNGVLWFLFHDLFDRVRRPRFDHRFREAWDAYRTVNDAFADGDGRGRARRTTSCS